MSFYVGNSFLDTDVLNWDGQDCLDWAQGVCFSHNLDAPSLNLGTFRSLSGEALASYSEYDFCCLVGINEANTFYREFRSLLEKTGIVPSSPNSTSVELVPESDFQPDSDGQITDLTEYTVIQSPGYDVSEYPATLLLSYVANQSPSYSLRENPAVQSPSYDHLEYPEAQSQSCSLRENPAVQSPSYDHLEYPEGQSQSCSLRENPAVQSPSYDHLEYPEAQSQSCSLRENPAVQSPSYDHLEYPESQSPSYDLLSTNMPLQETSDAEILNWLTEEVDISSICGEIDTYQELGYFSEFEYKVKEEMDTISEVSDELSPQVVPGTPEPASPSSSSSTRRSRKLSRPARSRRTPSPTPSEASSVGLSDDILGKVRTSSRKRERGPKNWEYLMRLLCDPEHNPRVVRWEDRDARTFRIVKPHVVAQIWGQRANKAHLTYDNFARGLRYHYKTGALYAVSERQLVYKCGPKALNYLYCLQGGMNR